MVENQTGLTIKVFCSDGGGEYTSHKFDGFLCNCGIIHEKTAPHSPQQNGLAEVMNQIIVECLCSMLFDGNLPKGFWVWAALMAVYLTNQSPAKHLNTTPHEAWTGNKPMITDYQPFGCPAYAHVPKQNCKKLDSRTHKCIMVGYMEGTKAY